MDVIIVLSALIVSALLTLLFKRLLTRIGGNLYTSIRGGTPRAVGLAPFLVMLIFLPPPGCYLIAIMGGFAFFDDIVGREKIKGLPFELGQFSRGLGLLLVIFVGYYFYGPVSILIGLMIQPLNIADMQPGTACSTIIIMTLVVFSAFFMTNALVYLPALIILAICVGYAPLDYKGKIMMGEVGNHSFGVALGVSYAILSESIAFNLNWNFANFFTFLLLFILTVVIIAFLRRKNLHLFLQETLSISDPTYGDYFMDVLTGGGLGDLFRRILFSKRSFEIKNRILMIMGFRRLLYNPYAH